jgi:[ribosomal protein S5]-alanine N-acetyltransferase
LDRQLQLIHACLRAPRAGDAAFAHARWAADPLLHRWLGHRPNRQVEQTGHQLAWDEACWLKKSAYTWLLVPHGERGPVGLLRLLPQGGTAPHHLRLGFVLARSHQGRGLMSEAVAGVLAHALAQPGVWRIDAVCDVDNTASQRLLVKAGMHCEGRLARHTLHPNVSEQPRDVWLFVAVRPDAGAAAPDAAPALQPAANTADQTSAQPTTGAITTLTSAGGAK